MNEQNNHGNNEQPISEQTTEIHETLLKKTNKHFLWIILLSCIIISIIIGFIYYFSFYQKNSLIAHNTSSKINKSSNKEINNKSQSKNRDCDDYAKIISKQKDIKEIKNCNLRQYTVDNETINLVAIDYGEGMDCESGCIYQKYTGLIDSENNIYDFTWNPPLELINDFAGKYGRLCTFTPWKNTNPASAQKIEIIKDNQNYFWKVTYNNYVRTRTKLFGELFYGETGCVFNGTIVSNHNNINTSNLEIEPVLVDCNKIANPKKVWICWSDVAAVNNDINICKTYSDNNFCYDNVAKANLNIDACSYIKKSKTASYDPKNKCLNYIKNKR